MASANTRSPWSSVWITGGSSGIGMELARLLDGRAAQVAVSARSADALEELAKNGRTIKAFPLDVTDAKAVAACVKDAEAAGGALDLAVFCAGAWKIMDAADMELEAVRTGVEVNIMGVMNCLAAVLPGMLARGHGHIAIVASVAGYRGLPRALAYGPTKAALINLAETLRCELQPRGITVSLVNPGFVDTPMTRDNPFPMPGLIPASEAAASLLDGLLKGRYEIIFPRGFVRAMKLMRLLPNAVYFWVVGRFVLKQKS